MTAKLPYVRYGRISKLNGREPGDNLSIADQDRETIRIAKAHRLPRMEELIADEDVSGSTFDRPGWEQAIKLVKDGKAAGIIAWDWKRISRGKVAEVMLMIEDVESAGGRLYDSGGRVSVETADAEMIAALKAMIARRDWRERKEYLDRSVESAIERGVHLQVPFGYRRSNGKGSRLTPVPAEAAQVLRAFELRAGGTSWQGIAATLNESGATPRPHKRHGVARQAVWQHKTVKQIVANEVYLGTAFNREHRHPGAHDAIVTPDLFAQANRVKGVKHLGPSDGYLLTGLARCAACGYTMTYQAGRGGLYLRCRSAQHGAGRCPAPASVPAGQLEEFVIDTVKDEFLRDGIVQHVITDDSVVVGEGNVSAWTTKLKAALALRISLGELTGSEAEAIDEQIAGARAGLRTAEGELLAARRNARGAELPPELTEALFDETVADDVAEARHWISLVYRTVIVRAASRWREPAVDRAQIVSVDVAPADSTGLIAWVAAQPD